MYLSGSAFLAKLRHPNKQFKVKPEFESWDHYLIYRPKKKNFF